MTMQIFLFLLQLAIAVATNTSGNSTGGDTSEDANVGAIFGGAFGGVALLSGGGYWYYDRYVKKKETPTPKTSGDASASEITQKLPMMPVSTVESPP